MCKMGSTYYLKERSVRFTAILFLMCTWGKVIMGCYTRKNIRWKYIDIFKCYFWDLIFLSLNNCWLLNYHLIVKLIIKWFTFIQNNKKIVIAKGNLWQMKTDYWCWWSFKSCYSSETEFFISFKTCEQVTTWSQNLKFLEIQSVSVPHLKVIHILG